MALEQLDATIARIIWTGQAKWQPAGMPRVIAKTTSGQTILGPMWRPALDSPYRLWGAWRLQKPFRGNPPENAFEFLHYEALCDRSEAGLVQYLRNHIDGLGPRLASRLVDEFGEDTLDVLRQEPERSLVVKGITEATVTSIREHFDNQLEFDPVAYARLVDLFASAEVKVPQRIILKLLEFWGSAAPDKVKESPYLLMDLPRMGWKTVDGFALSPPVGYDPRGLARQEAAILEALERISDEGHTYADRIDVEQGAFGLLQHCPSKEAWDDLIDREMLWTEGDSAGSDARYALPTLANAEETIAERLRILASQARPLGFDLVSDRLNDDQRSALEIIQDNGVALLIGPPGVGKSWTVAALIECLVHNNGGRIKVVAPTGKAAKRAKELVDAAVPGNGIPCTTIHKALGPMPSGEPEGIPAEDARVGRGREGFTFIHGIEEPMEVDYLIVDETSMVSASLMASLLLAVPSGCRVLFVGDQNQLPSVGPGSVLRDLIDAGIPAATLTKIVRSDGGGRVVRACHAIKDGRVPEPAEAPPQLPTENWVHIEESDPARIAEVIAGLCRPWEAFPDPVWDIQVISAQHDKPGFGCKNLNRLLSRKLNPRDPGATAGSDNGNGTGQDDDSADAFEPVFTTGDKVIRRKNGLADLMRPLPPDSHRHVDWTWNDRPYAFGLTEVVNGDMGTVEDIVLEGRRSWVVVRFRNPERLCRLPYGECHLQRAYAITVHSSQGSGFPMVIVPVSPGFYWDARTNTGLWCRELVYTAISRAERLLVTVGEEAAIRMAVGRKTIGRRRTRLKGLIEQQQAFERQPEPSMDPIHAEL